MSPDEIKQLVEETTQPLINRLSELQREYDNLRSIVEKNNFSTLSVFPNPVRTSAPISAQAGGKIGLYIGSGAFGIYYGSGAPTVSASKGSLYLRIDGSSSSTRAYSNTDGGTTWVSITTAS